MKRTLCTVLTALTLATALPAIGATTEAGSTSAATTGTTTGATVGTTAGTTGGPACLFCWWPRDWRQGRLGQPLLSPPLRLPA